MMTRNTAVAFGFAALLAGCGSTALWGAGGGTQGAAASPRALRFLPAKEEAVDPGEITEGLRWHFGIQAGIFGAADDGELAYDTPAPIVRGLLRLGADRASPLGIEFSAGYVELRGARQQGENIDTSVRELMMRARGLLNVGPDWLYPTAGMQLVYEDVEYPGKETQRHFGATLDLGANFRLADHVEGDMTLMFLLGSQNSAAVMEFTVGLTF